jgi:hypothetical protein
MCQFLKCTPGALGAFKVDLEAPFHIEADKLVEVSGDEKQAVFTGIVDPDGAARVMQCAARSGGDGWPRHQGPRP